MKLYHGSNQPVETIDLSKGKSFKDFGRGFYMTHLPEQAAHWANRIAQRYGGPATVTCFEFDIDAAIAAGLNVRIFGKPDREWALFVMANRKVSDNPFTHDYDIVIGPVANDNMARLFGLYELEIIDLEAVVAGLEYKNLNSQYFFATEKALQFLKLYDFRNL